MAIKTQEERLKDYVQSLSELEKLSYCRKQISVMIKNFKAKENAVNAEFNYTGCRTGLRGGKMTSLSAKAVNQTQAYLKSVEDLKLIVKYL